MGDFLSLSATRVPFLVLALCFLFPLLLSGLLTSGLIRWSPRLGLMMDYPSARKFHTRPTPRAGGLAIFFGLVVTATFFARLGPPTASALGFLNRWGMLAGLIVIVGLVDDLSPLAWQVRLGIHTIAAVLTLPFPLSAGEWLLWGVDLLWIVTMINAFNMLDNMDALAGGVAWIAAGFFVLIVVLRRRAGIDVPVVAVLPFLMLMGSLSGFLGFNLPPARIFMGDAGSTFLGFFLGVGSLLLTQGPGGRPWEWAAPLCVCAVPCYDLLSVVLLRLKQGRSPFLADKQHLSHRLVQRGFSPSAAVRLIWLLALASGASGLLLYAVASWTGAALVGLQFTAWWSMVAALEISTSRRAAALAEDRTIATG